MRKNINIVFYNFVNILHKKFYLYIICVFIICNNAYSGEISKLSVSEPKIYGEKIRYHINIPSSWTSYIKWEKEKSINSKDKLFEKITFYYESRYNSSKPIYLMSIYVLAKGYSTSTYNINTIYETSEYVFGIQTAKANPFTNKVDKALFTRFLYEVNNTSFIKSIIYLYEDEIIKNSYTIKVNNYLLNNKIIYKENSVVYLPLRETCEALGYNVTWDNQAKSIIVIGKNLNIVLQTSDNSKNNYDVILINNVSYVSSLFFMKEVKANVEVDERNNVNILKSS